MGGAFTPNARAAEIVYLNNELSRRESVEEAPPAGGMVAVGAAGGRRNAGVGGCAGDAAARSDEGVRRVRARGARAVGRADRAVARQVRAAPRPGGEAAPRLPRVHHPRRGVPDPLRRRRARRRLPRRRARRARPADDAVRAHPLHRPLQRVGGAGHVRGRRAVPASGGVHLPGVVAPVHGGGRRARARARDDRRQLDARAR